VYPSSDSIETSVPPPNIDATRLVPLFAFGAVVLSLFDAFHTHGGTMARAGFAPALRGNVTVPKLIQLHTSPFSERVRWAFDVKRVPYEKASYTVVGGEEELARLTGQRQVPVLVLEDRVIPDSTAILEWLETCAPAVPLLPAAARERAQAMLYEELACAVLGPEARQLLVGRMLVAGDERLVQYGRFLGRKYGHSEFVEGRARAAVRRALTIFVQALEGRRYLVGDTFTRADLTLAAMLMVVHPASDDLFVCSPSWMRPMFEDPMHTEAQFAPLFAFRDRVYREHRGGPVAP
jgi:glutathione S-transferase